MYSAFPTFTRRTAQLLPLLFRPSSRRSSSCTVNHQAVIKGQHANSNQNWVSGVPHHCKSITDPKLRQIWTSAPIKVKRIFVGIHESYGNQRRNKIWVILLSMRLTSGVGLSCIEVKVTTFFDQKHDVWKNQFMSLVRIHYIWQELGDEAL